VDYKTSANNTEKSVGIIEEVFIFSTILRQCGHHDLADIVVNACYGCGGVKTVISKPEGKGH